MIYFKYKGDKYIIRVMWQNLFICFYMFLCFFRVMRSLQNSELNSHKWQAYTVLYISSVMYPLGMIKTQSFNEYQVPVTLFMLYTSHRALTLFCFVCIVWTYLKRRAFHFDLHEFTWTMSYTQVLWLRQGHTISTFGSGPKGDDVI